MSDLPVLARGLTKRYGDLAAVEGIDFEVRRGECFGILGPNGAGKTTTVRMIYGFFPITAGRLEVFGLDVATRLREVKARIGVCQQENNLDPDFTVLKNLVVYARYFGIPRSEAEPRARELLDFMALGGRADADPMELSGGQQRRVVLARALMGRPDLLLLDEPSAGLDPQARHQLWDRLGELKRKGLSILLTTHYMDEAAHLCDRLIIVDHGKILVEGRPRDLVAQQIGADVIEIGDPDEGVLEEVRRMGLRHDPQPGRLYVYSPEGEPVFRHFAGRCRDGDCLLRRATLEDVFLKLTGRELRE